MRTKTPKSTKTTTKSTDWFNQTQLPFNLPEQTNCTVPFSLVKYIPERKYDYVSDFFRDNIDDINKFNVVILFSKKDMGKSFIGYL